MLTAEECQQLSQVFLRLAEKESEPQLKRLLEGHGLALAEIAARAPREDSGSTPRE